MATYSSTFAWKIPWKEEPGRLQSMGSLESDTTEQLHFHFSLSCIGEGNGNPLQCSCLENPRDRGAWWAVVYGVVQSQTRLKRLSNFGLKPKSCKAGMLFSHSVVSNSLRHHGLQHTSLPGPLLSGCLQSVFQQSCTDVRAGPQRRLSAKDLMLLKCGAEEDS